jgi:hypothetical protein
MQQEQVRLLTKLLTAAHRNKLMSQEPLQTDICVHILSVSAGMVGVCLTVIGLFRVITELKSVDSIGDNLLAVDALAFLTSLSFPILRSGHGEINVIIGWRKLPMRFS